MYQGFRLILDRKSKLNIFGSFLAAFEVSSVIFKTVGAEAKFWLDPKIKL